MLCLPQERSPIIENWIERHNRPVSFILHMIGIPLSIVGVLMLPMAVPTLSLRILGSSLALFVLGYAFQFLGHALEGSEPGEIMALRRWLTRSRVSRGAAVRHPA